MQYGRVWYYKCLQRLLWQCPQLPRSEYSRPLLRGLNRFAHYRIDHFGGTELSITWTKDLLPAGFRLKLIDQKLEPPSEPDSIKYAEYT